MKLGTCILEGKDTPVYIKKDVSAAVPLRDLGYSFPDLNELIRKSTPELLEQIREKGEKAEGIPMDRARLCAPIPYPVRVLGLGLNYQEHSDEMAEALQEEKKERLYPIYWEKGVDRCPGPGEEIPSHADFISTLDYETELAVILAKDAKHVAPEDVRSYVFGYSVLNDVTARELNRHKQNYFMKSLDGTCPMGPWIVTADEIAYPPELRIRCHVNGESRQDGNTRDMIFGIDEIVGEITKGVTLPAGTVIATGSPTGIGFGMKPPVYLKDGDVCRCEIEGIGVLENRVSDTI